jgi:hypothetical protein
MIDGRKVIQVTPGYCSAEMFDASRSRAVWTPGLVDEFWLLLNKYPLPSVEENEARLIEVAAKHGYRTFDSGDDLGLQGSLNKFFEANPQPVGTICIGFDADSGTNDVGFDQAICDVICADPMLPFVALGIPETADPRLTVDIIGGRRVYVHRSMMMFNICGSDLDFIMECGGFWQPVKYWGGLEGGFYPHMQETGKHIGYLMDFREGRPEDIVAMHDPRYSTYKWEHFYGRFPGSFAEYLDVLSRPDVMI